jgi:hypothetical protein
MWRVAVALEAWSKKLTGQRECGEQRSALRNTFVCRALWLLEQSEGIRVLLGDYTASWRNYLPTFRDNVSVPSSRVKIYFRPFSLLRRCIPDIFLPFLTLPQYSILWPCIQTPHPLHPIGHCHIARLPYPALLPSFLVTSFLSISESRPMKMGPTRCPETSVITSRCRVITQKTTDYINIVAEA